MDTKELITRAKQGDGQAWTILFRAHQAECLKLAVELVENREDAEDLVQEAWLLAWQERRLISDLGRYLRSTIVTLATGETVEAGTGSGG